MQRDALLDLRKILVLYVEHVNESTVDCVVADSTSHEVSTRTFSLTEMGFVKHGFTKLQDYFNNPLMTLKHAAADPRLRWSPKTLQLQLNDSVVEYKMLYLPVATCCADNLLDASDVQELLAYTRERVGDNCFLPRREEHGISAFETMRRSIPSLNRIVERVLAAARDYFYDPALILSSGELTNRAASNGLPDSKHPGLLLNIHRDRFFRWSTASIFLNDDYEGGQTVTFESASGDGAKIVAPKTGRVVMFTGSRTYHSVYAVRNGNRYQLILWFGHSHIHSDYAPLFPLLGDGAAADDRLDEPGDPVLPDTGMNFSSGIRVFLWHVFTRFASASNPDVMDKAGIYRWCLKTNGANPTEEQYEILRKYTTDDKMSFKGFEQLYMDQAMDNPNGTLLEFRSLGWKK